MFSRSYHKIIDLYIRKHNFLFCLCEKVLKHFLAVCALKGVTIIIFSLSWGYSIEKSFLMY